MNRRFIFFSACLCLLALAALTTGLAYAAASSSYDLSWFSVDGGGGPSSSTGNYSLGGTAGQPDAGTLSGTGYSLAGGFWGAVAPSGPVRVPLYLPFIRR